MQQSVDNTTVMKVHLKFINHHGHFFLIYPQDYDYVKQLYDTFSQIQCIHESVSIQTDKSLDSIFKRFLVLATTRDHHMGKSIHNTDNVDAVFTHYSSNVKTGSKSIDVNINDGVLSHFRNDLYFLARQLKSSIRNLKIDIEYYLNLISNYSNICNK